MDLYESLAGKELKFMEQETVSQTALSVSDTSMSFSTRTTPQYENRMEGYRLRNKDFQEVTVFGVNSGDHVDPFDGKLSFLTKEQKEGKGRSYIDWSHFVDEEDTEDVTLVKTFEHVVYDEKLDITDLLMQSNLTYLQNEKQSTVSVQEEKAEEEDLSDY